ncbi:MAG: hypothetical protein NUV67_04220 [archaeon]|nr:hypothetical protein [archaeon]
MVKALGKGAELRLVFDEAEALELGFDSSKEYALVKAKQGIWILTEEQRQQALAKKEPEIDEMEQKIIGLLNKLSLSERVEGSFEAKLSPEGKKKLEEMVGTGKIEKFKLNESYKKAVYQVPEKKLNFENTEKPFHEFTLEDDGFVVVKNEQRAKALSDQYKDRIKDGEIKGTRAFTGEFYIANSELLEAAQQKTLRELKEKKHAGLTLLAGATHLTPTLIRIAIEFLKEEGQVIEKKKDDYQYIE